MRLTASDFYSYWRPSTCGLRVHYRHQGLSEGEPGPYDVVIRELGGRHEQAHLRILGPYEDLRDGSLDHRAIRTLKAIRERTPVIYQGVLHTTTEIDGQGVEVLGEPDFLIRDDDGYLVRDTKISRRITEKDHPEILRQLELYGWLYQQALGALPTRLQVFSGGGETVDLPLDGCASAPDRLEEILRLKLADPPPVQSGGMDEVRRLRVQPAVLGGGRSRRGRCPDRGGGPGTGHGPAGPGDRDNPSVAAKVR